MFDFVITVDNLESLFNTPVLPNDRLGTYKLDYAVLL